ncbi:MAG: 3-isopropylmalate dehydratase [Firmicutes bacterium]|nr:3-isopropylmalate dehydratase [Bacillota bacterium]
MNREIKGTAFKFGDNINTDIISPPQYMELSVEEASVHAMEAVDPTFSQRFQTGDIIVAGTNFGSGSSRETSPLALRHLGTGAIVAKYFARIFYRNCINIGLPLFECPETDKIDSEDVLRIDTANGIIYNETKGEQYQCSKIPEHIMSLIEDGGLVKRLEKMFGKES